MRPVEYKSFVETFISWMQPNEMLGILILNWSVQRVYATYDFNCLMFEEVGHPVLLLEDNEVLGRKKITSHYQA